MRVRSKSIAGASWLGMAMLAFMSTTGCEILSEVDRSQIPDGDGGVTTSSSSSSSSSSGSMAECTEATVDADCPDPMNECVVRTCTEGKCGTMPVASGTEVTMGQTTGDCKVVVCDGNGATTTQDQDTDLPDDGSDCTDDTCNAGQPVFTPKALNTACGTGGMLYCDANGKCVGCTADAQCGTASDCATPACDTGTCKTNFTTVGTATTNQTAGDCQEQQCDGIGGTKNVPLTTDINNDNNSCTADACNGSTPTHTNLPSGSTCTSSGPAHVCDGAGSCVECISGSDCTSHVCIAQVCAAPTCTDGVSNGTETDVDCGGTNCTPCVNGLMCKVGTDCMSTVCGNGTCVDAVCGDNRVTGTEGCDDGNTTAGDGCSATCTVEPGYSCTGMPSTCTLSCGTGTVDPGEQCDDGNKTDGDGCSSTCTIEPGYTCNGMPSVCKLPESNCSNGIDDDGDGKIDGADSDCALPAYFSACGAGQTLFVFHSTSAPLAFPYYPTISQDDVNVSGTNGIIMKTAMVVNVTHPYAADVLLGLVGPDASAYNSILQEGGAGANFTNTILDSTCATPIASVTAADAPFSNCYSPEDDMSPLIGVPADGTWSLLYSDAYQPTDDGTVDNWSLALCVAPTPVCGNGVIEFGEVCDDQNSASGDGCSSTCTVETGYQCSGQPSVCTASVCGNGVIESGETCDDHNTANADGCSSTCNIEPNYTCTGTPSVCTLHESACSDGTDNDGDGNTDGADSDCALPSYFKPCGSGEKLYVFHAPAASTMIPYDPATFDSPLQVAATNGAGVVVKAAVVLNVTHTYDADVNVTLTAADGSQYATITAEGGSGDNYTNTILDTLCPTSITTIASAGAPFSACYSPEDSFSPIVGTNGDGTWTLTVTDTYPSLDDGTLDDWSLALCVGAVPLCGNGVIQSGEECDDNGTTSGDGCSATCQFEPGYHCSGQPSVCAANACGDGYTDSPEECDDGNTTNGDGCTSTCTLEANTYCVGTPGVCSKYETNCSDGTDNDGDGNTDGSDSDCALPAYFPGCQAGQTLRVYKSHDTPIGIPDNDPTGILSYARIVDNIGNIANGALLFNVTHTWDGDVNATLFDPNGGSYDITLGNGTNGDNYVNTIFESTCPPVSGGTAPFSGCYAPDGSVAALLGTAAQGVWQLGVVDTAAGDVGTLNNWALILCTQ